MKRLLILLFSMIYASLAAQTSHKLDSLFNEVDDLKTTEGQRFDHLIHKVRDLKNIDFPLSEKLIDTVLILTNVPGLEMQYSRALGEKAMICSLNGNDQLMVANYLEAVEVLENYRKNAPDSLQIKISSNISVCYNNIAQAYLHSGDNELAMDFYKNSLDVVVGMNDSLGISIRCYNISHTYKNLQQYDSAMKYILWSKDLEAAMGSNEGLAWAHEGLSQIYKGQEKYFLALNHVDSAFNYAEKFGDEFFKLDVLLIKSEILKAIGGIAEAIEVLELGGIKSKQLSYKSWSILAYSSLSELYELSGDFKKAFQSLKRYNELIKEVESQETQEKIEEFQVQYKTEQKDKEIANLATQNQLKEEANKNLVAKQEAEKSASRIIYIALGSGVALLGLIGVLLFRASQRRKKTNDFLRITNENLKSKNEKIESQAKQIADSIAYARNIQNAILPLQSELAGSLSEHFVYYLPKDIVSGDFYWYHELKDQNKALLAVADCTGHGVPGAFMSIVGHALLEKIVKQLDIFDTDKILNQLGFELNNTLQKGSDTKVNDGMDIALISIDLKNNVIEYSGARNQLIFIHENELTEYKGDRIDLGKGSESTKDFTKHQIKYAKGDSIYLFSDGYVDQKGGELGKKFFMQPFRDLIQEIVHLPLEEQKIKMNAKFNEWKGSEFEQMDDVLVMGVRL